MAGTNIPIPLGAPIHMFTYPFEIRRAHAIKAAVEADATLRNLTDFEYMQYAIVHPATEMPTVCQYIARMQAFKEEYRIQDTVEEGIAEMDGLSLQQPGYLLGVEYLDKDANCVSIEDFAAVLPQRIQTPAAYANFIKGYYYKFQALHPTVLAIRSGFSMLVECEGTSSATFCPEFFQQLIEELILIYPKQEKTIYLLNSPSVVNVLVGLWRRFMTDTAKRAFKLGYQLPNMDNVRLDQLYTTPNREDGRQRMLRDTRQLLQTRYRHEATYQLPPIDESPLLTLLRVVVQGHT